MAWEKLTANDTPTRPTGRQLPRAVALETLTRMVAADIHPGVDGPTLDALLDDARQVDSWGRHWDDEGWIETFDLNAAAAAGWEAKAGRLSDRFDVSTDGSALQRSQLHAHCLAQADRYRARIASGVGRGTVRAAGRARRDL